MVETGGQRETNAKARTTRITKQVWQYSTKAYQYLRFLRLSTNSLKGDEFLGLGTDVQLNFSLTNIRRNFAELDGGQE